MSWTKQEQFRFTSLPFQWVIAVIVVAVSTSVSAYGQTFNSTTAGDILSQMRSFRTQWTTNIWTYAQRLFWFLAFIEFGWSVIALALDKTDLQSWIGGLIRKMMWIGAFDALLVNGSSWIPAVIDSFEQIGQSASGLSTPISPSGVFVQGLDVAGSLLSGASGSAFLSGDVASALLCAVGALLIFVSYVVITINLVVTLVESYLVVSAGYIFLGFGGSRWTAPYTERYIGLAVSIGVKLLVLYCVISAGQSLGAGWNAEASGIGTSATPAKTALDVIGGALIYMMCCWQIPKLFGAVIGGSPALTGGDLVMAGTAVAGATLAAASLGAGAVAGATGSGSAAVGTSSAANAMGSAGSSVASAMSNVGSASTGAGSFSATSASAVRPPTGGTTTGGNGAGVRPPTSNTTASSPLDPVGGQPLAGSGFERELGFSQNPNPSCTVPTAATDSNPNVSSAKTGTSPDSQNVGQPSNTSGSISQGARSASNRLRSTSDALRRFRLNDNHAPSSPPRMPIDHHE